MGKFEDATSLHEAAVELDNSNPKIDFEAFRLDVFEEYFGQFCNASNDQGLRFASALSDALSLTAGAMGLADQFDFAKEEYISIINALAEYFDLSSLRNFTLDEVKKLHNALQVIELGIEDGRLQPEDISKRTRDLAHSILLRPIEKEKWSDRSSEKKERAIDFLIRVWGTAIKKNTVKRSDLADKDEDLYRSLNTFYSRAKKKLIKDPGHCSDIPSWVFDWLAETSIATSDQVDQQLKDLGISSPSDVFSKDLNLSLKEQQRLYEAAKRRFG